VEPNEQNAPAGEGPSREKVMRIVAMLSVLQKMQKETLDVGGKMKGLLGKAKQSNQNVGKEKKQKVVHQQVFQRVLEYDEMPKDDAVEKMLQAESKEQVDEWYDALEDLEEEEDDAVPLLQTQLDPEPDREAYEVNAIRVIDPTVTVQEPLRPEDDLHMVPPELPPEEDTEEIAKAAAEEARALAAVWVKDIFRLADRHCQNGLLTVNEMRTYLARTKYAPFLKWLTGEGVSMQGGTMHEHDTNREGGMLESEVFAAVLQFFQPNHGAPPPSPQKRTAFVKKRGRISKKPINRVIHPFGGAPNVSMEVREFLLKHGATIQSNIEKLRSKAGYLKARGQNVDSLREETDELVQWLAVGADIPKQVALMELCAAFPTDLCVSTDCRRLEILLNDGDSEELQMWQRAFTPIVGGLPQLPTTPESVWGHPKRGVVTPPRWAAPHESPGRVSPEDILAEAASTYDSLPPLAKAGLAQWDPHHAKSMISTGWAPRGTGLGSAFTVGGLGLAQREGLKKNGELPRLQAPPSPDIAKAKKGQRNELWSSTWPSILSMDPATQHGSD